MLLVVRHARGRGRRRRVKGYLDPIFEYLRDQHEALARQIRVHETGQPRPSLDGVVSVVFTLADPLREWYPDCYAEAVEIADDARSRGIPTINPPEVMSNSIKSSQARRWQETGIPTPEHWRFETPRELRDLLERVKYPCILRSDEAHAQGGLYVCRSRLQAQLVSRARRIEYPGTLTPLMDLRRGFRRSAPGTIRARLHHKKRVLVLGRVVQPDHLFFSSSPIVSSDTCTFRQQQEARLPRRAKRRARDRACIEADLNFWREGDTNANLMRRAAGDLGFQFAAMDYADTPEGGAVLWEANPHFLDPPPEQRFLPELRKTSERDRSIKEAFRRFFDDLLEGRVEPLPLP